jgi:beta-lactamase regulating signal transducer with metallopeptidase domain
MNTISNITVSNLAARWDAWSQTPNVLRLSTLLLHFVWQGALAAALATVLLAAMRRRSPQARYVALLALFALMTAAPIVTWFALRPDGNPDARFEFVARNPQGRVDQVGKSESQPTAEPFGGVFDPVDPATVSTPSANLESPQNAAVASRPAPSRFDAAISAVGDLLRLYRPWIATAWLVGVALLGLRLALGLAGAELTRRRGRVAAPQAVERAVAELAGCLGIRQSVAVFESAMATVPTLVGWLSPVILLPASAISGLTTQQLEAVLAHELAHVRRRDYLVNLLQTVVETLLFYHPAVWWLSRKIRQERELCCDDIAVELFGDRVAYARALATLEERRTDQPGWVTAASGGVLADRIRRVVGRPQPVGTDRLSLLTTLSAMFLVFCVVGRTGVSLDAASHPAEKSSGKQPPSPTAKIVLAGRVVDEAGKPIAGARACWVRDFANAKGRFKRVPREGSTDTGGRFRIERPATEASPAHGINRDVVWVLAPKMEFAFHNAYRVLAAKEAGPEWEIRLKSAKDLTLVVHGPDGQPLNGAVVTPWNIEYDLVPDSFREQLWRTTDQRGEVMLPAMASALLQTVRVESDQYGTEVFGGGRDHFLADHRVLAMSPVERVQGQVLAADPKSFRGLEAVAERYHPTLAIAVAKVDEQGRFDIQNFPQRVDHVSLRRDSEAIRTLDPVVEYDRERHITKFTIGLEDPVLVRGTVQTEDTHVPIPGAEVAVVYGKTSKAEHVVSDPHGKFAARVLPGPVAATVVVVPPAFRGKYLASAQADADKTEVPFGAQGFQLPAVYLAQAKAVQGKLVDDQGQPIAGASVAAEVKNRSYSFGRTNARANSPALFPTLYRLTITRSGFPVNRPEGVVRHRWQSAIRSFFG